MFKKILIIPALLIGVAALVIAIKSKTPPRKVDTKEKVTVARVITIEPLRVLPRAIAYGNVQPGTVWNAVSEVGGEIVETHPQLKKGAILPDDEVLFRIDPVPYELIVTQIEAEIAASEAKLAELSVKEANTRASLTFEERSLILSRKDLERQNQLKRKKAVAQAAVDKKERNVIAQEVSVQLQRNTLNLIPAERQTLEAELALNRAKLENARLDLKNTVIRAPFDCRIAEVNAEKGQFAGGGQTLAVIDSIDVSEVSAQLPIDRMMAIMARHDGPMPETSHLMDQLPQLLGLEPVVRLRAGEMVFEWPARLARISDTIDPQTRTVGVIVAVDAPYAQVRPGYRPPLIKNMFVEVELRGRARDGLVVVPRAALHGRQVYVVAEEDRLKKRPVEILFRQGDFVVLKSGLEPGERLVVTDLIPAVEGMKLIPAPDAEATARLKRDAAGEGSVR